MRILLLFYSFLILLSPTTRAQSHSFAHYHVALFRSPKARLHIKGNPLAEEYRTIIKDTYYSKTYMKRWHGQTGQNFAGHYSFVYWGCGSPCQMSAVVDLKTGIIYAGVDASFGYLFKRDSRLMLINPGGQESECSVCEPQYWVWNERDKKFNKIN